MADYTKITDFAAKDALLSGNPAKIISGTAHDNEYNAIAVAIATKYDSSDVGTGANNIAAGDHVHTGIYQTVDAELTAIAGLTSAADKTPYFTGSGTAALATYTAAARTFDAAVDAAAQRIAIGAPDMTQAEAEAGTGTSPRSIAPIRLKQAIASLTSGSSKAARYPDKFFPTLAWFELFRLSPSVQAFVDSGSNIKMTQAYVEQVIDEMATTGITTVMIPYVEYFGYWFYTPGFSYPTDHDTSSTGQYWHTKLSDARVENFNPIQVILERAKLNDMKVYLGLGRNGDSALLQDLYNVNVLLQSDPVRYGLTLTTRLTNAQNRTRQVAQDLITQFGGYTSFYGFYLSHEPGHIGSANAYMTNVNTVAGANVAVRTHNKPIMVAPSNTVDAAGDLTFANLLVASGVDVFAPQDAAGPGLDYSTGFYTYVRSKAINSMATHFAKWRSAVVIANGKTQSPVRSLKLISTTETWQMGTNPAATLTPSATSGSVTFTATAGAPFASGDVGKILWINGGQATITAYTSSSVVVGTTTRNLSSTSAATSGNWAITTGTNGGYTDDYPTTFSNIQNQLFQAWPYVDAVSLYGWFGHVDSGNLSLKPSQTKSGITDYQTRAAALYASLNSHIAGKRIKYIDKPNPSLLAIETLTIPAQTAAASVGVDFGTYSPLHDGSKTLAIVSVSYTTTPATVTPASIAINLKANGFVVASAPDKANTGAVGGGTILTYFSLPLGLNQLYRLELSTDNGTITLGTSNLILLEVL